MPTDGRRKWAARGTPEARLAAAMFDPTCPTGLESRP